MASQPAGDHNGIMDNAAIVSETGHPDQDEIGGSEDETFIVDVLHLELGMSKIFIDLLFKMIFCSPPYGTYAGRSWLLYDQIPPSLVENSHTTTLQPIWHDPHNSWLFLVWKHLNTTWSTTPSGYRWYQGV